VCCKGPGVCIPSSQELAVHDVTGLVDVRESQSACECLEGVVVARRDLKANEDTCDISADVAVVEHGTIPLHLEAPQEVLECTRFLRESEAQETLVFYNTPASDDMLHVCLCQFIVGEICCFHTLLCQPWNDKLLIRMICQLQPQEYECMIRVFVPI